MRARGVWRAFLVLGAGLLAAEPAAAQQAPAAGFEEAKLGEAPADYLLPMLWVRFAPGGGRVAFAMRKRTPAGPRVSVLIGARGKPLAAGPPFVQIPGEGFHFSRDGSTFAYKAEADPIAAAHQRWVVMHGEKQAGAAAEVGVPVLSDDGRHVAWTARPVAGDAERVVLDGRRLGGDWSSVLAMVHLGQYGRDDEAGWPIGANLRFAPGSATPAFVGRLVGPGEDAGRWMVVWGSYRSRPWLVADYVVLSPTGKRMAYWAQSVADDGERSVVVVDGKPLKTPFERVGAPAFGPRGKRIAYKAEVKGGWVVVVHGKKPAGGPWFSTGAIIFRPDGGAVAYRANVGGTQAFGQAGVHGSAVGGKWHVVNAGKPGAAWDWVADPRFDASGKHCAYAAYAGAGHAPSLDPASNIVAGKWRVVVDEQPGPEYDAVGRIRFSPDGTRVAYLARAGRKLYVVAGAKRSPAYEEVPTAPVWSLDGTKVAYGVTLLGRQNWWKVLPAE